MVTFWEVIRLSKQWSPERPVFIVGPHPSVYEAHKRIPDGAYTIVLNRAIGIPEIEPTVWMVADSHCPTEAWFKKGSKRMFRSDGEPVFQYFSYDVFRNLTHTNFHSNDEINIVTFEQEPPLRTNDVKPSDKALRWNGTVFSQALQACYWMGVKRIFILGVAFEGNQYFDGSRNPRQRETGHWNGNVDIVNNVIQFMEQEGIRIWSMSRTRLKVRSISPNIEQSSFPRSRH